jgi:hypothetical protein
MSDFLKGSGFTWQVDQAGMILPGTFTDPSGKLIPSLQINVSPSVGLPLAVQENFKRSIMNLGIDLGIQTNPNNSLDLINFESNTPDIVLDQWISILQGGETLCGISPQLIDSGFPVYLKNDIYSNCHTGATEKDINPLPSPTPPVMVSGKIAKSEGLAQPWLTLLYGSIPGLEWIPGLETKYDISWLQTLSPVWISGWGN